MKRRAEPRVEINTEQAFGLSARVHRELGGFFKEQQGVQTNKERLHQYLLDGVEPTPADVERGQQLLAHCRGLIMRKLANDISQFDTVLLDMASRTTITDQDRYHLAILAAVPQCVSRSEQRSRQDQDIKDSVDSYVAPVGAKITARVRVVRSQFSPTYSIFFNTAKTQDNHVVFFAYKEKLETREYDIRGTVKAHRDDYQTQLNRVKIL